MESRPPHSSDSQRKRLSTAVVIYAASFKALCIKQARRISRNLKTRQAIMGPKFTAKSVLKERPKELMTSISNKAMTLMRKRKVGKDKDGVVGDGAIWQREILMGDKCQPLDFSGVIYYDSCGKQVNELPLRSPRASPLNGYGGVHLNK